MRDRTRKLLSEFWERASTWRSKGEEWTKEELMKKRDFLKSGIRTWELYLLLLSIVGAVLVPVYIPGVFVEGDTTPDSDPYETIILFDEKVRETVYVNIRCTPTDYISTERVAYQCDFRFERIDGSLQKFSQGYIRNARGKTVLVREWRRRIDADSIVIKPSYRFLTPDLIHPSGDRYTIHGSFGEVAPRNSGIWSFSTRTGDFFGNRTGDVQSVTVFSPAEASTFRTRDFTRPFQWLVVIGLSLSFVRFWIELLDRIHDKIHQ